MASDRHGDAFRDSLVDHVADRRAAEIMPNHANRAGFPARGSPCLAKVSQPLSFMRTCKVRKEKWDDIAKALLQYPHTLYLCP